MDVHFITLFFVLYYSLPQRRW